MKIKDDFVLRKIADTYAVLPLNTEILDFNGMITLNESGALLWEKLSQGGTVQDLLKALLAEYDVTEQKAAADIEEFIGKLKSIDCLEDL